MPYPIPDYIDEALFEWDGGGYHFLAPPPAALRTPAALRDDNPWAVLAAVLLRAQQGEFESVPLLLPRIRQANDYRYAAACLDLFGDVGGPRLLETVLAEFHKELWDARNPDFQVLLGSALRCSRLLWAAPRLLDLYLASTDREETGPLTIYLSRFFEPALGPVGCADLPDPEYRGLVLAKYEEMKAILNGDRKPVLYGEPFSVVATARRLRQRLADPDAELALIVDERHIFEAATGIDCRAFWKDGDLQPLTAAAALEDFLESPDVEKKYEPGARYFFGRRLPD